ncbi:MAG: hypothetical protein ACOYL8_02555 [Patescibacteria group bacterium]
MKTKKTNVAKNLIDSLNNIYSKLSEETGQSFYRISYDFYLKEGSIKATIQYDFQKSLNFESCCENWFKRLCCHIAHGNDSCGSQEFIKIKRAHQRADLKVIGIIYDPLLRRYITDSIYHSFEIDRFRSRTYVDFELAFPLSIFSKKFQELYKNQKSKKEHEDIEEMNSIFLEELDYWDEFYGPRPASK